MKTAAVLLAMTTLAYAAVPVITSPANSVVTQGSTQISAVVDTGGLATRVTLRFGIKPANPDDALPGLQILDLTATPQSQNVAYSLSALVGNQTYAYTIEATNTDSPIPVKVNGADFFVAAYKPTVTRGTPVTSSAGTATLKGTVIPNGAETTVTFDYGKTTSYELGKDLAATPPSIAANVITATTVTRDIGSLERGVLYHYQLKAKNGDADPLGTSFTPDASFTIAANKAPITREDKVILRGTEPVLISPLSNDRDPEGDGFSIVLVSQGSQGRAEIVGNQIRYTPLPGAKAGDSFTYTVKDDYASSPKTAVGKITIVAPGLETKGLYSAEVTDEEGNIAGMLTLFGTGEGPVTGKLHLYDKTYTVRGTVDENGHFYYTVPRKDGTPIQIDANFTQDSSKNFTADLSSGSKKWSADSTLYELSNARRDEIVGRYTVQLPGGSDSDAPKGTGHARLDVRPWGEVKIEGRLGDGSKFTSKGVLTGTDQAPVVSMWTTPKNARVDAKFNFGSGASPTVTGEMRWYRPPDGDADFFPQGFYTTGTPSGSRYEPPPDNQRALEANGSDAKIATLTLSDGNLNKSIVQQLTLSKNDKVTFDTRTQEGLTLKIDRSAGTFKGEFDHPIDNSRRKFTGVILQSAANGKGVFVGVDQSGTATLAIGAAPVVTPPQQPQQPDPNTGGNGNTDGNIDIPGNVQIPGNINLGR